MAIVFLTSCLRAMPRGHRAYAYALAAIASRIIDLGLTPNRHAVCGWNIVTLAMLAGLLASSRRAGVGQWASQYRRMLPRLLVPATVWSVWILLILLHV